MKKPKRIIVHVHHIHHGLPAAPVELNNSAFVFAGKKFEDMLADFAPVISPCPICGKNHLVNAPEADPRVDDDPNQQERGFDPKYPL